ncbi:Transposase Tc1-like [Trinorchestia longiramus]|nr:Transposase Tc1-like [Trinorchestia longiramus]
MISRHLGSKPANTIIRTLRREGLRSRTPHRTPLLQKCHVKARMKLQTVWENPHYSRRGVSTSRAPAASQIRQRSLSDTEPNTPPTCPPARGGRGEEAPATPPEAFSPLPLTLESRPSRLHIAEPLPRRINTTIHQNTTQHSNNHSINNHNTRPTYNHTKNTTFRIQLRKINPDTTTDKQKIFETTFKDLDVLPTKLSENNSGYYAITDEAAAVDKLTSFKATKLFKKLNLRPIIPPDVRAKRTIFIRQLDSSIGKLTPEEIAREKKTQQPWAKILEVTKIENYTHLIKITFSEISITQKILQNGLLMFNTKITPSQIKFEKYTYIQICYKCYKFEDHATYQCTSTTPSCSECVLHQHTNNATPTKKNV